MPVTSMSKKPRGTPWSDDERRFVREAYPGLGPAAIARKLGRSRSGVCALWIGYNKRDSFMRD